MLKLNDKNCQKTIKTCLIKFIIYYINSSIPIDYNQT